MVWLNRGAEKVRGTVRISPFQTTKPFFFFFFFFCTYKRSLKEKRVPQIRSLNHLCK